MEKIPAACAMEWSIELEKGLRSKKPGKSTEAVLEFGPRLEWWNREHEPTMAEYDMFDLIPGEDMLFANAILLRLADAFRSGDKHTKLCVVKVFLTELRRRKRNNRRNGGVLSKRRLENQSELLRRVKMAFDDGDVEVKAMALVLFGCWADFAKDSAEIRYVILSTVVSYDVVEVKASLFAAGCFCELSDDFASVLLEILVNMVLSSENLMAVRLAGVRALAKMGCSSSLANRAHKTGLKMALESSEEDFSVAMLISLSKIASKSMLLISVQVDLLFSFLTQDKTLRLRATSLRCLQFILARGVCHFPVITDVIKALFDMINEPKFPPAMKCEALQILHKILLYNLPNFPCTDKLEFFSKLVTVVQNVIQSPCMSKRLLASRVLVDVSVKLLGRTEMSLDGIGSTLTSRAISFVIDRISLLVKSVMDLRQPDLEMEREVKSSLNLLVLLVEECPNLSGLMLDNIYLLIKYLVNIHERVVGTGKPDLSGHESMEFGRENKALITSKLMLYVSRVVVSCLESFNNDGPANTAVHDAVKLLIKHVHWCSLYDCYVHTVNSLLLHYHITRYCMWNEIGEYNNLDRNLCISDYNYLVQHGIFNLECAKKLLAGKDKWSAYKAGRFAACQGSWFTAAFIFQQLITVVQSGPCCYWLKSLAHFAHSEMKMQSLLLPKQGSVLSNWFEINSTVPFGDDLGETGKGTACKINSPSYIENLVGACKILHSSEQTICATVTSGNAFGFQRWFLSLRAKVLEIVVDILKLLGSVSFTEHNIGSNGQVKGSSMGVNPGYLQQLTSVVYPFIQMSSRLKRLAQEFDLIAISFLGMDCKSSMIISVLALSCSLLAFSTGFALFIPNLHALVIQQFSDWQAQEGSFHAILIEDLARRLWHIDRETSTKLRLLSKACGQPKSCLIPQPRNQMLDTGYEARGIIRICSYAVTGVIGLQKEANKLRDDEILSQITSDGLQLLLNIITKWMHIPFCTPNHFFRVRPCISSQLFARHSRSGDGISVLPGFHLSLNLCLQLKNIPANLPARLTKLYCILYCRTSFQLPCPTGENEGHTQLGCQEWGTDEMVDLNEKLLHYVTGCTKTSTMHGKDNVGDCGVVDAFVCFKPNERGQGFSTCLLDVSAFPVGSYRIKWHSCFVDSEGSYWSLFPLNSGPVFTVQKSSMVG